MSILNGTTLLCNATTPCPLPPVQTNQSTLADQSRFLGVTLGMDPLSSLGLDPYNSSVHIQQYRAVVTLKQVVNMIAYLHLLKLVSVDDHSGACFCKQHPVAVKGNEVPEVLWPVNEDDVAKTQTYSPTEKSLYKDDLCFFF